MTQDDMSRTIDELFAQEAWGEARRVLRKEMKETKDLPPDHWLLARLATTYYEERDYQRALKSAEQALAIVSDCPLALWERAGALQMLGRDDEATRVYGRLIHLGRARLEAEEADEDAGCWESRGWTLSLVVDCTYRAAVSYQDVGNARHAAKVLAAFNEMRSLWDGGVYTHDDAARRLKMIKPASESEATSALRGQLSVSAS